jgi:HJR/Mrr/RecB family endonuclease
MSNSRNDISKLIQQIQKNNSILDSIKPSLFESVVAETITRNNTLLEISKKASGSLDFIGKYRDPLGKINSFAIETKQFQKAVEASQIHSLAAKAAQLNIDKSYLITNSKFTNAAIEAAAAYKSNIELIDRSGLNSLIEQYRVDRELFANSIAAHISALKSKSVFRLEDPEPSIIDSLDPEDLPIDEDEKSSLITVDRLPLRLLSKILSNPSDVRNITPRQFEEFIAELLSELGFNNVILTPRSGDGGKDVIASHSVQGIPLTFYFECKKHAEGNKIQLDTMRSLLGVVAHDSRKVNKGILVTTSTFTKGCKEFILAESRVDGKDYNGVLGWVDELRKEI